MEIHLIMLYVCTFRISIQPEMSTVPFHILDDEACPEENEDPETEVKQCPLRKHWCRLISPRAFVGFFVLLGIACMVLLLIFHSSSKGNLICLTMKLSIFSLCRLCLLGQCFPAWGVF